MSFEISKPKCSGNRHPTNLKTNPNVHVGAQTYSLDLSNFITEHFSCQNMYTARPLKPCILKCYKCCDYSVQPKEMQVLLFGLSLDRPYLLTGLNLILPRNPRISIENCGLKAADLNWKLDFHWKLWIYKENCETADLHWKLRIYNENCETADFHWKLWIGTTALHWKLQTYIENRRFPPRGHVSVSVEIRTCTWNLQVSLKSTLLSEPSTWKHDNERPLT